LARPSPERADQTPDVRDQKNVRKKLVSRWLSSLLLVAGTIANAAAEEPAQASHPGEALFRSHCAQCHDGGLARAPNTSLLRQLPSSAIYDALTQGVMRTQAVRLSDAERGLVAEYLAGRSSAAAAAEPLLMCTRAKHWFDHGREAVGAGWGIDEKNTRFVSKEMSGLAAVEIPRLKLKWAFAYPNSLRAASQPTLAGGAVFVGGQDGTVYALDADRGCVHWTFKASGEVRGAYVVGGFNKAPHAGRKPSLPPTLYFGDIFANVYALDAETGEQLWKVKADEHSAARVYATPVLYDDGERRRLYVPLASFEEVAAAAADYPCCTFRGSIVALNPDNGATLWKSYTIAAPAVQQSTDERGRAHFGPSGAGVWSTLTVDRKRRSLYFTTGNNYSAPADGNSDAIFAMDIDSGEIKWTTQTLRGDAGNMSCSSYTAGSIFPPGNDANCPPNFGPDVDFTAPPILLQAVDGREMLVAGQKSGDLFGLDPASGAIVWKARISESPFPFGSSIYFGMAAQAARLFVPIVDFTVLEDQFPGMRGKAERPSKNGIYAVDGMTGRVLWSAPTENGCRAGAICQGYQAAPMTLPGAVMAASRDGYFRAFAARTGRLLWEFDTKRDFASVSGAVAKGGGMAASSFIVGGGRLYINSGYGGISGALPGNALLVFSIDGR
jgi:polyvinyl alcohol dehydrogenase (cytochrome)